jgi:glucose-1-phosphate adenylyltransferase
MVARDTVFAYPFSGYWVDVGTIQAYWETSLDLVAEQPALDLYDPAWVIHTRSEEQPPVKLGPHSEAHHSLLSNGCVIDGTVINSVLSPGVRVERGAIVRDSVIMNDTTIRAGAVIDRCVLDKEIEIGADAQIGVGDDNTLNQIEPDKIYTGITIIGKRAQVPAGVIIGRNCRIDSNVTPTDFEHHDLRSGMTVSKQEMVMQRGT